MPAPRVNIEAEFKRFQEKGRKFAHKSLKRWPTAEARELTVRRIIYELKYHKVFPAEVAEREGISKPFVEQVMRAAGLRSWRTHRTRRALVLMRGGREFKWVAEKTDKGMSEISELAKKHGIENPRRLTRAEKRELTSRLLGGERPSKALARDLRVSIQTVYRYKAELERILLREEQFEPWLRLQWNARFPDRKLFPDEAAYRAYYASPWAEQRALREILILGKLGEYVKDATSTWMLKRRLKGAQEKLAEVRQTSKRGP